MRKEFLTKTKISHGGEVTGDTAYLDTLRVFATFAVIMIHVFSPINLYFRDSLTDTEAYVCVVLKNLWQWCVPVFVMITGVLFLNPEKEITLKKILKRHVLRIVAAIILFGTPYCFMEILFNANMSFNIRQIGIAALNAIQGKSWDSLWYLYMIAGIYLCVPLMRVFVVNASKQTVGYMLTVLFVFTSLIPSLEALLPYRFGIYIPINSVYLFYLLLGYYVHYNKITVNHTVLSLLLIAFACFTILMSLNESFIDFANGGCIKLTGDDSPVTVALSLVVFCFLHQRKGQNGFTKKMAPMCFGIYLIHVLFINLSYKFMKITPEKYPLTIVIPATALTTILLSIVFSSIGRQIKILRKYVL